MSRYDVCGIRFFVSNYDHIASIVTRSLKKKIVVAPLATHPVMEALFHKELQRLYNNIEYVLPDGYIVWAIRMIYKIPITERIYGPDLLLHISQVYAKLGTSIFLCGNNCNLVQKKLTQLFPRLVVAGSYEMMGKKYSASLVKGVNNEIAKTKPSCVFIGIGSPNQHLLASKLNIQLPILCVGAGFDFIAGVEKQAPLWMRNNGFEWLYRLIHNPRRLWKRYLIFGPLFMILVAYKRLSMKVFH